MSQSVVQADSSNDADVTVRHRKSCLGTLFQWFLALLVMPAILLVLGEVGLRAIGFGHTTKPFIVKQLDNDTAYIRNKAFLEQFFTWTVSPDQMMDFTVMKNKPDMTYRVFVFGSSAAMGWPTPSYSFPRILKAMLKTRFPRVNFEIYNCAFTGTNSHVMRPMAMACADLQPDLYVVYMGNNEVHGPFGLMTMFVLRNNINSLDAIRMRVALSDFRLSQLLSWGKPISILPSQAKKQLDEQSAISPVDPRLPQIYDAYRTNLEDMCRAATQVGSRVILSTVGVNLRHWAPIDSKHIRDLNADQLTQWDSLFQAGKTAETAGSYAEAVRQYEAAWAIDDTYAELAFHLGTCLTKTGNNEKAHACFLRALEYDSFGWARAKQPINDAVAATATKFGSEGVYLVDSAQRLAEKSPTGTPGVEFFWDSCHMTFAGSYEIASGIYEQIVKILPDWISAEHQGDAAPPIEDECARLVGFDAPALAQLIRQKIADNQNLGQEPIDIMKQYLADLEAKSAAAAKEDPFVEIEHSMRVLQPDHDTQYRYCSAMIGKSDVEQACFLARGFVAQYPCWHGSHRLLAEAYVKKMDTEEAMKEFRTELSMFPYDTEARSRLQALEEKTGKVNWWQRLMGEREEDLNTLTTRGHAYEEAQDFDRAIKAYSRAMKMDENDVGLRMQVAGVYLKKKDAVNAAKCFREAVAKVPSLAQNASANLGQFAQACKNGGELDKAIDAYRAAISLNPQDLALTKEFGALLEEKKDFDGALGVYRQYAQTDSANTAVLDAIDTLIAKTPNPDARIEEWRTFTVAHPESAEGWRRLGKASREKQEREDTTVNQQRDGVKKLRDSAAGLLNNGQLDQAIDLLHDAAALDPKDAALQASLGQALERKGDIEGAFQAYRQSLSLEPKTSPAQGPLEVLLAAQKDPEVRVSRCQELLSTAPDSAMAHLFMAEALLVKPDIQGAVGELRKARALEPINTRILRELAEVLVKNGEPQNAVEALRSAIELGAEDAPMRFTLIALLTETKDFDGAWIEVKRCREKNQQVPGGILDALQRASQRAE